MRRPHQLRGVTTQVGVHSVCNLSGLTAYVHIRTISRDKYMLNTPTTEHSNNAPHLARSKHAEQIMLPYSQVHTMTMSL